MHSARARISSLGSLAMCLELRGSFRCWGPWSRSAQVAGRNRLACAGDPADPAEVCYCCHWLAGESARWQALPSRGTTARGGRCGSRDRDPTAGRNSGTHDGFTSAVIFPCERSLHSTSQVWREDVSNLAFHLIAIQETVTRSKSRESLEKIIYHISPSVYRAPTLSNERVAC